MSSQLCYCVPPAEDPLSAGIFAETYDHLKVQKARMALDTHNLEHFLKDVEKRAFRMAHIATSNVDDALDIVQDAMMVLASKYAERKPDEWPPLFHRILQNKIRDWYRRQKVRNIFHNWFSSSDGEEEEHIQTIADDTVHDPVRKISGETALHNLEKALKTLPIRQQQTFLLRSWECLDVKQTAEAMGITTGSVKTHYSRAVQALKKQLDETDYE
jgi:RNA polymerase sigma-70 factor (ECF subfamily)